MTFTVRSVARPPRDRRSPSPPSGPAARLALLAAPLCVGLLGLLAGLPDPDVRTTAPRAPSAAPPALAALPEPEAAPDTPDTLGPADFDGRPAQALLDAPRAGKEIVDAGTAQAIAKLQAKLAKAQATLVKKQAALVTSKAGLAKAQLALIAALTLPESTPALFAAKQKAIKKASKSVNKKLSKVQGLMDQIAALEVLSVEYDDTISDLINGEDDPDDPPDSTPTSSVSVPLLVQEILPAGATGFARDDACATFGIPFAQGDVPQVEGRPALSVLNSATWQTRTLSTWPDGSVQWALIDTLSDVPAGGVDSSLELAGGTGASEGPAVASEAGNTITLDTGVLQATVVKSGFNLFDTVRIGGTDIVAPHQSAGVLGQATDGQVIVPRPDTLTVSIAENGPARAVVEARGTLMTVAGTNVVDFTCLITARRGSADLQVDFTVRNASIARPQHVVIEGLGLVVKALPGAGALASLSRHDGQQAVPLPPGSSAYVRQAYSSASVTDVTGSSAAYKPPIPKLTTSTFAEEGYELVVNDVPVWSLGDKTKYPAHGYVDLTGATGGVTLSLKQMPYFWPACLEAWGSGDVVAGLWSARNVAPYTFCWRQHESRSVSFSFHKGAAPSPLLASERLDWPVTGRAADFDQYDSAGVFAYRLPTLAEENEAYALMGVTHTVGIVNDPLSITRYLAAHNTGGPNNHDSIERRLGGEWLRQGHGGQWLNGMDLALYKSEWQILRSDDFDDQADPGAGNDGIPHSTSYEGDLEHRYRDGMVLAYFLSGDERLRDALYDDVEILDHLANTTYERSLYQSLKALAAVGRFTGSEALRDRMHAMLAYILPPTLDVDTLVGGFGWEGAPGVGTRRYYVNSQQNIDEKPVGENYVTRGFISACLGPIAYFNAATWLGPEDSQTAAVKLRLQDLAFYTRHELFPWFENPADRHLVYSWAVHLKQVVEWENADFHPILLGMAEAYLQTGDAGYLSKGVEQIQAFKAHDQGPYSDNLYQMDSRFDALHFLAVFRDFALGVPPP